MTTPEQVEQLMLKMKMGKVNGLNGVPIEVVRINELESVLARIGNNMMNEYRMPESWRSVLIPPYNLG